MAGAASGGEASELGRCPSESARARWSGRDATPRELVAVTVDRLRETVDAEGGADVDAEDEEEGEGAMEGNPPARPSLNVLPPGADAGPAEEASARGNFLAGQGAEGEEAAVALA